MSARRGVALAALLLAAPAACYTPPDSGLDFRGKDLNHKDFASQYLNGANFEATNLTFASFHRAKLQRASFRGADVVQTNFNDADLTGADFSRAVIDRATFSGARLNGANLEGQTLHLAGSSIFFKLPDRPLGYEEREMAKLAMSGHLHNHNLILKGANLKNARVFGNLDTVDLRKADLRGADLSACEKAEPRFFAGALYDTRTRFPPDIEPARVGAVQAPEPALPAGPGVAGHFWRVREGEEKRLLHVYADGTYAWSADQSRAVEGTWSAAPGGGLLLRAGPGGEDWTVTSAAPDAISLRSSRTGRVAAAQRGEPIR